MVPTRPVDQGVVVIVLHLHWLMASQRLLEPELVFDRLSDHLLGPSRLPASLHLAGGNDPPAAIGHQGQRIVGSIGGQQLVGQYFERCALEGAGLAEMGEPNRIAVALKDEAVQYRDGLLCLHFRTGELRFGQISLRKREDPQARAHQGDHQQEYSEPDFEG